MTTSESVVEVQRPAQGVPRRLRGRCAASTSRSSAARLSRCSARTARARAPRSRSSRATATAPAATRRARHRPAARRPGLEGAARHRAAVQRRAGQRDRARAARPLRRALPQPAQGRRGHRRGRARGEGVDAASRSCRAASAAGSTSRSGIIGSPELLFLDEPTTGFDPGGAAAVLGPDPGPQARGHHHPADHALPRRGGRSWPTGPGSSPVGAWSHSARSTRSAGPRRGSRSCAGSRTARCANSAPSDPANWSRD